MLSGERKGTNKYYPPDFDPAKHGSLNGYHKTHALRERARKLSQGILIIRFEMPYNIWCDGCKNHIGMGKERGFYFPQVHPLNNRSGFVHCRVEIRGVKLILVQVPHSAPFDLQWTGPVKSQHYDQ
uniref:Probable splicing factor YJU2B n=1 Tax=Acanthochromis polyacanthus TaxID=80966 RepID=A0A3Q1FZB4_9TELE